MSFWNTDKCVYEAQQLQPQPFDGIGGPGVRYLPDYPVALTLRTDRLETGNYRCCRNSLDRYRRHHPPLPRRLYLPREWPLESRRRGCRSASSTYLAPEMAQVETRNSGVSGKGKSFPHPNSCPPQCSRRHHR